MDCDAVLTEYRERMPRMSKREVRSHMRTLCLRQPQYERSNDYLLHLKARAEEVGAEEVSNNLYRGAWRRAERHDDPGSADQMLFCCAVLDHFGPVGLTF